MTYIVQKKSTGDYIATKVDFGDGDHCWSYTNRRDDAHHFKDRAEGKAAVREFRKPNSISSCMRENPDDFRFIKVEEIRFRGEVHIRTTSGHLMPLREFQKIPGNTSSPLNQKASRR